MVDMVSRSYRFSCASTQVMRTLEANDNCPRKTELLGRQQLETKRQLSEKTDLLGRMQLESKRQLSEKTGLLERQLASDASDKST
jgi:hypothetical protein